MLFSYLIWLRHYVITKTFIFMFKQHCMVSIHRQKILSEMTLWALLQWRRKDAECNWPHNKTGEVSEKNGEESFINSSVTYQIIILHSTPLLFVLNYSSRNFGHLDWHWMCAWNNKKCMCVCIKTSTKNISR